MLARSGRFHAYLPGYPLDLFMVQAVHFEGTAFNQFLVNFNSVCGGMRAFVSCVWTQRSPWIRAILLVLRGAARGSSTAALPLDSLHLQRGTYLRKLMYSPALSLYFFPSLFNHNRASLPCWSGFSVFNSSMSVRLLSKNHSGTFFPQEPESTQ